VKGALVALMTTLSSVLMITVIFRLRAIRARAAMMMKVFMLSIAAFIVVHRVTPYDLWLLPDGLVEAAWPIDLVFGLVVYAALFLGGVLQIYAQADRGFSARILLDIADAGPKGLGVSDVMREYSAGKGIGWLCERRIEGMIQQAFVVPDGKDFVNSRRGIRTAAVAGWLRDWLRLPRT
jgi:hypothetical protein